MKPVELIERNAAEIVTSEELAELLKKKTPARIITYCGYEVSGPVHLGTMVAVQKQLDFQEAGLSVKVLLADLHTLLNRKGEEKWIAEQLAYWKNSLVKLGLTKAEFVTGSTFQLKEDYIRDILSLGLEATLKRAKRSMQEVARDMENARVSQIIYPLMQVADIKALGVNLAHGGMEQRKIHMLARETLPKIGYEKPVCLHTPLLSSLQGPGAKMSSSRPETIIAVDDAPASIEKKIAKAYCPLKESADNPVMQICNYLVFPRRGRLTINRPEKFGGDREVGNYQELEELYRQGDLHPADLKKAVSESLIEILEPLRL